jgi:hypothetical protein
MRADFLFFQTELNPKGKLTKAHSTGKMEPLESGAVLHRRKSLVSQSSSSSFFTASEPSSPTGPGASGNTVRKFSSMTTNGSAKPASDTPVQRTTSGNAASPPQKKDVAGGPSRVANTHAAPAAAAPQASAPKPKAAAAPQASAPKPKAAAAPAAQPKAAAAPAAAAAAPKPTAAASAAPAKPKPARAYPDEVWW